MMFGFTLRFLILQTIVLSRADKLGPKLSPKSLQTDEFLQTSESRYQDYSDRDYPTYDRILKSDYNLPVTFKAPHYEAHDYWRQNKNDYDNRRTFFEDFPYTPLGKTTPFPNFYKFMTSIFSGGNDNITPDTHDSFHYNQNRITPPYGYNIPFNFRPTEPNYIPPPKPIRASVIKLETITRPPIRPSYDYETTTKYYPTPGNILNHVIIENTKPDFHPETVRGLKFPPFKPLPVLPKPGYTPPTTLKPGIIRHYNQTDYKYPDSVQDQLPHVPQEDLKIPYVSEKPIPQIFNRLPTESPERLSTYDFYPSTDSRPTTNFLELIDIRSLNPTAERRQRPISEPTEGGKSFPGAVEKVNRPTFTKKLTAQLDRKSIERVTNLTVQGYARPEKDTTSIQPVNYLNVRNLINYEMNKLNKTNTTSSRSVNLNDELSLDAKILKDTNWDGWTTTEFPKETTTIGGLQSNKTAFWEISDLQSTTTDFPIETTTTTTTVQPKIRTTTEFIFWTSTPGVPETSTIQETTPKEAQRREEHDEIQFQTTTPRKRYNRRPKITNFTPYPSTPEEIRKKIVPRNNFPKRSKPNITLSFGNKNVLKNRGTILVTDEVMKFSDEDIRKRRKIGKRRHVVKRIKVTSSSSERPVHNE